MEPTLADMARQIAELTSVIRQLAANQPLVDLQVAAKHIGVSTRTLRRMCEAGEIPFRRVGRQLRFQLAMFAPRSPANGA